MARTLGADHVIDTPKKKSTKREERYDRLSITSTITLFRPNGATFLKPGGICVLAGDWAAQDCTRDSWTDRGNFTAAWRSPAFGPGSLRCYVTTSNQGTKVPGDLVAKGKVTPPFVEKTYSLDQTAEPLRYFEEAEGHDRGS